MSDAISHKNSGLSWSSAIAAPDGFKVRREGIATLPAMSPKIQAHIRDLSVQGRNRSERRAADKQSKRAKSSRIDLFALDVEHVLAAFETPSKELNPVMDEAVRILRATSVEAMRLTTKVHETMIESGLEVYAALVRPNDLFNFDALILVNPDEMTTSRFELAYDAAEEAEDEAESNHILIDISFLSTRTPPDIPEDRPPYDKLPESLEKLVLEGYVYVRIR